MKGCRSAAAAVHAGHWWHRRVNREFASISRILRCVFVVTADADSEYAGFRPVVFHTTGAMDSVQMPLYSADCGLVAAD